MLNLEDLAEPRPNVSTPETEEDILWRLAAFLTAEAAKSRCDEFRVAVSNILEERILMD